MVAVGTSGANGDTGAGAGAGTGNGTVTTTVGTKDPDHVNESASQPTAKTASGEKKEGPCGLPVKCVIL